MVFFNTDQTLYFFPSNFQRDGYQLHFWYVERNDEIPFLIDSPQIREKSHCRQIDYLKTAFF